MKRSFLLFMLVACCAVLTNAQTSLIKFKVKAAATELKITSRMTQVGSEETLTVPGVEPVVIRQPADALETTTVPLVPQAGDYDVTLTANNIEVLRVLSSKAVIGVEEMTSSSLKKVNLDYTKLTATPLLDFSQCPNIEEITVNCSEVTDVVLPADPVLNVFQVSSDFGSTNAFKSIDLSKCKDLKTLGLQNVSMDTIDLRACPQLEQFTLSGFSSTVYPKCVLGAKALKSLTFLNINKCGLGYNDLPDLNDTPVDNFKITNIYFTHINRSRVKNLTVDLSHLARAYGLSSTPQPTAFTWFRKVNGAWETEPLDTGQVTEKDGVFTFSPSILDENGKAIVRCRLFNPGYPDIEAYKKTGLMTSNVTVSAPDPNIIFNLSNESPGEDEDGYPIEDYDMTMMIGGDEGSVVTIDWGAGAREYTITSAEPQQVTGNVSVGGTVKVKGDVKLIDATAARIQAVTFPEENRLEVVRLSGNKLTKIDLSNVKALKEFAVSDNQIETLNLNDMSMLEELYCAWNKFAALDLSGAPRLNLLTCYNNQLTGLDVTMLPDLAFLTASDNPLGKIDLSKNSRLVMLDVSNCGLADLAVASPSLRKVIASGNRLDSLALTELATLKELNHIDLRRNQIDACTLNDFIYAIANIEGATETEDGHKLFVAGNPGAATYDAVLLESAANKAVWTIDEAGDGTGCESARLFGKPVMEHGTATLSVDNGRIAFGEPVGKGKQAVVTLTPEKGYVVSFVKFEDADVAAVRDKQYGLEVKHNGTVTYGFTIDTGIDNPFAEPFTICRNADGYVFGQLPADSPCQVVTEDGKVIASGIVAADGSLNIALPHRGIYFLTIGKQSLKLVF